MHLEEINTAKAKAQSERAEQIGMRREVTVIENRYWILTRKWETCWKKQSMQKQEWICWSRQLKCNVKYATYYPDKAATFKEHFNSCLSGWRKSKPEEKDIQFSIKESMVYRRVLWGSRADNHLQELVQMINQCGVLRREQQTGEQYNPKLYDDSGALTVSSWLLHQWRWSDIGQLYGVENKHSCWSTTTEEVGRR